jgi:hypothetical protein
VSDGVPGGSGHDGGERPGGDTQPVGPRSGEGRHQDRGPERPDPEHNAGGFGAGSGLAVGAGIGAAIGVATNQVALWLPIGIALGLVFGVAMGRRPRPH